VKLWHQVSGMMRREHKKFRKNTVNYRILLKAGKKNGMILKKMNSFLK